MPTLLVCFYVCVCTDGLVRTGGSSVSVCLAADDYRTCLAIFHGLRPLRPPSPPHPSTSRCWPSLVDKDGLALINRMPTVAEMATKSRRIGRNERSRL